MNLMILSLYQLTGFKAASLFQVVTPILLRATYLTRYASCGLDTSEIVPHVYGGGHKLQDQGPIRSRVSGGCVPLYICLFVMCSHGGELGSLWDLPKGLY